MSHKTKKVLMTIDTRNHSTIEASPVVGEMNLVNVVLNIFQTGVVGHVTSDIRATILVLKHILPESCHITHSVQSCPILHDPGELPCWRGVRICTLPTVEVGTTDSPAWLCVVTGN